MIQHEVLKLAAHIVDTANKDIPADALVRREAQRRAQISQAFSRQLSHAVFSYFKWKGWLLGAESTYEGVRETLRLAELFEKTPAAFPDVELLARAVPAWVNAQMEVSAEWVRFLQAEPTVWLRARHGEGRLLLHKFGEARAFAGGVLEDTLLYSGDTDLFRSTEFHNGAFEIQDISSQAVGFVCAAAPGETWWDACAGEGGKLLHLSDLMRNKGLIWASDRAPWRLQKLKRRAARAKAFNYRVAAWDGGSRLPTKTLFDGVLVDAPCSGLGTWQRNPHARWTTSPEDVEELSSLQKDLLVNASKAVKPGGKLVYSVCTLTRAETNEVVDAVERSCPELKPLLVRNPLKPEEPSQRCLVISGEEFRSNGMFIAGWVRSPRA